MSKSLTTKPTTDIVDFACLAGDATKSALILKENLGTGGINQSELTRIKIPAGGGLSWTVPSIDGENAEKTIQGIIVHFTDVRAYWKEAFTGEGTPPTCSSTDGITGLGEPGGKCTFCPLNEFGTGTDAKGQPSNAKACKEGRLLFLLRPEDLIPIVVSLSTMSIRPSKRYFLALAQRAIPYYGVVSELGLEQDKNSTGIVYSKATFKATRQLTDEEIERVKANMGAMQAIFAKETVIEETELRG